MICQSQCINCVERGQLHLRGRLVHRRIRLRCWLSTSSAITNKQAIKSSPSVYVSLSVYVCLSLPLSLSLSFLSDISVTLQVKWTGLMLLGLASFAKFAPMGPKIHEIGRPTNALAQWCTSWCHPTLGFCSKFMRQSKGHPVSIRWYGTPIGVWITYFKVPTDTKFFDHLRISI